MKFLSFKHITVAATILLVLLAGFNFFSVLQLSNVMNMYSNVLQNVSSAEGIRNLQANLGDLQGSWKWILMAEAVVAFAVTAGLGILFYRLLSQLLKILKTLQMMSNRLSSVTKRMLLSAEKQEEIALQQSASINQTSGTATELSVSTSAMMQNARQVTPQVQGASSRVLLLSEKLREISKITSMISEITQQINLLSLNAAIEAARAGEHGRGFAVVTSELRKLAENTSRSTEEIVGLIADIQASAGSAAHSIEQATDRVKHMARNAEQQELATSQLISSLRNVDDGAKQNVAVVRQTVSVVEELNNLSTQLTDITDKFRLNGRQSEKAYVIQALEKPLYQNG
jgi:methyl-accepting chemotaxis protein